MTNNWRIYQSNNHRKLITIFYKFLTRYDYFIKYQINVITFSICIEKATLSWLADISDGDARIALNNLQMVVQHNNSINKLISVQDVKDGIKV